MGGEASRKFFKLVKNFICRERPPDFDVRTLYLGEDDKTVAEKLADHFNAVSSEFSGLEGNGPPMGEDPVVY